MDTPSVVGSQGGGRIKSGVKIWWVDYSNVIEDEWQTSTKYCAISV
jgi:hypothetical protein